MVRILILGGYGQTGTLLARHLLQQTTAEIIVAGRHLQKARAYADQLNREFEGERASGVQADASSAQSLREALRAVDLVLVAAPTARHVETVVHAALESETDYLDIQLDARKLAVLQSLAPEIGRAGRCFITEAGFHPGLPSAMVRYAATQLDRLDTATIAGYLNIGREPRYSEAVDELMEVFRNYQGQVYKDSEWARPGSFDIRKVDFGGDIGIRKCYSMFFEELRALPQMYPSLRKVGFYISETHWFVDYVITPLVLAGLKLAPRRGVRPLGKLMWWAMQTFPKPPYRVVLKVEATGEKGGKPVQFETSVSHPDGYALTAIPVVACVMQYLDGSAHRTGVWMMGHLVNPARLFEDMGRIGVQVTRAII